MYLPVTIFCKPQGGGAEKDQTKPKISGKSEQMSYSTFNLCF